MLCERPAEDFNTIVTPRIAGAGVAQHGAMPSRTLAITPSRRAPRGRQCSARRSSLRHGEKMSPDAQQESPSMPPATPLRHRPRLGPIMRLHSARLRPELPWPRTMRRGRRCRPIIVPAADGLDHRKPFKKRADGEVAITSRCPSPRWLEHDRRHVQAGPSCGEHPAPSKRSTKAPRKAPNIPHLREPQHG